MSTVQRTLTAGELLTLGDIGRCELIEGELVRMSPGSFEHGAVALNVGMFLGEFVKCHQLGIVTAAETGFKIRHNPDTVRAPDAAFVSAARIPEARPHRGFFDGAPDLAVEVVSPDDRWSEIMAKARDWLGAGCRLVWIVDPRTQTVTVYEVEGHVRVLQTTDSLDAGEVLPGFQVTVSELFPGLINS
jgi:Uma2 family endonuclease